MSRLVANLLDVTRLHARGVDLSPEPFDLRDLVLEVAGRFRDELRARPGASCEVEAGDPLRGRWDRLGSTRWSRTSRRTRSATAAPDPSRCGSRARARAR